MITYGASNVCSNKKQCSSKDIPVASRGGPQDCETSRFPHFLDNRLTDDSEVCQPYSPAALYPHDATWYSFLLEAETKPWP
jgi:hypothetical protein